jgi:hypothetical protein
VYTGRLPAPEVGGAAGVEIMDGWDAVPRRLLPAVAAAGGLIVLDPLSFPFDALRDDDRDVPLAVALPPGMDPDVVVDLLGEPLLRHLGPGDRVAADEAQWALLRRAGTWSDTLRLPADPADGEAVIAASLRPGALATRPEKARIRRRRAAIAEFVAGMPGAAGSGLRVLDVAGASGGWWENTAVDRLESGPGIPLEAGDESVDAVIACGVLGDLPSPERIRLVSEMWRVVRPAGHIVVADDVVTGPEMAGPAYPFGRMGLPRLLLGATGRRVLLAGARALRYPGDVLHRGAALSVVKTGTPQRW